MDTKIIKNRELKLWEALIPVFALIGMLAYNVLFAYNGPDDNALGGSNQFILLLGTDFRVSLRRIGGYRDWETDRKSTRLNSSH